MMTGWPALPWFSWDDWQGPGPPASLLSLPPSAGLEPTPEQPATRPRRDSDMNSGLHPHTPIHPTPAHSPSSLPLPPVPCLSNLAAKQV